MRTPTLRSIVVLGSLVFATLALSHHIVYLLAHGNGPAYAKAMTQAGHDRYWTSFLIAVGGVSAALAMVSVHQLRRLARLAEAARIGGVQVRDASLWRLMAMIPPRWLQVTAGTTVAFVLQENVETVGMGVPMPGLGMVSGDHLFAVPIIALVSLLLATVSALVRWRRDLLLARLRSTARPLGPRSSQRRAASAPSRRRIATGSPHGVRAPPPVVAAST